MSRRARPAKRAYASQGLPPRISKVFFLCTGCTLRCVPVEYVFHRAMRPQQQPKPLSATDPLGNTTTCTYDGAGNMLLYADTLGNAADYTCDASGNQTAMVDALAPHHETSPRRCDAPEIINQEGPHFERTLSSNRHAALRANPRPQAPCLLVCCYRADRTSVTWLVHGYA
jgi:YD repeat-containing protein